MNFDRARDRVAKMLRSGADLRMSSAEEAVEAIVRAAQAIENCFKAGGKVLLFGNGGSASDAQHIAAEFVGRFSRERSGLPAIALTTDTSAITSISNDYGFEQVFSRQVEALGRPGDIAIGLSTSGRSPNVLRGIQAAKDAGMRTIGFAGAGGDLSEMVDISLSVPSNETAAVQELHIAFGHAVCELVDEAQSDVSGAHAAEETKVVDWETLDRLRDGWRRSGATVVWTNGCFDLLHPGHLHSLKAARKLGDVLVVGLNSDESVRELKGSDRPIVGEDQRAQMLSALSDVNHVVLIEEQTPICALERLKPDIHCKGADYAPPGGKPMPEAAVVEAYGGRIAFIDLLPGFSTSDLLRRIQRGGEPLG